MSLTLYQFACSFAEGRLSAIKFADAYQEFWKIERDLNLTLEDGDEMIETLSTIFCLCDLFDPEEERDHHDLDENGLRSRVSKALKGDPNATCH